jgi:hypothetical protein
MRECLDMHGGWCGAAGDGGVAPTRHATQVQVPARPRPYLISAQKLNDACTQIPWPRNKK